MLISIFYIPFRGMLQRRKGTHKSHKSQQISNKSSVRKLFTLLGQFWKLFEKVFTNIFKPCSHIELNTQNPNTIFKIAIYYTK